MGLARIEEFHTAPVHVEKIKKAMFSDKKVVFTNTFIIAFVLGCLFTWLLFAGVSALSGLSDVVFFQGGGLEGNIPLLLFALIMAISMVPLAFPAPFFLLAGVIALVPPILWVIKKVVFYARRTMGMPVKETEKFSNLYHLRPVS